MEIKRVLKPDVKLIVALPCENGLLWNLGRELVTRRKIKKKYNINYDKVIAYEHVYCLTEIIEYLKDLFKIEKQKYLPFNFIHSHNLNLIYCGILKNATKN